MGMIKYQSNSFPYGKKLNDLKAIETCIREHGLIPTNQTIDDIYILNKISIVAILK